MMRVNLLPAAYVKRRRHHRRFRILLLAGCVLLAGELAAGIVVHARARRTRSLYAAARDAQLSIASAKRDLEEPRREAERLAREVHLAERLRTKHRWSRLLGTLARATPNRVLITEVSTEPPRWTPRMSAPVASAVNPAGGESGRPILTGMRLVGQAIDHQDLATFMAAIHGTQAFASLDLRQARRERGKDRESIMFELECPW